MSDEMNKNQGRQTQDKHRTPLQNLVLSSMADGDLFATLFNLYFYCMSECTDEVGYAWYSEDFSRAIKGREYDFLYETDVMCDDNEADRSFVGSFDSLKKAAVDYYYRAEDSESMAAAMKEIDSLEKTSFEQQTIVNWRELAPGFIAGALACMLLAFLLENSVMKRIP